MAICPATLNAGENHKQRLWFPHHGKLRRVGTFLLISCLRDLGIHKVVKIVTKQGFSSQTVEFFFVLMIVFPVLRTLSLHSPGHTTLLNLAATERQCK